MDALARAAGVRARVAVRLNPDIDAGGHPHISTGRRVNKFGVPIELGRDLYRRMSRMTGLQPVGVHVHIGSQITDLAPLREAAEALVAFVDDLGADGIALEHVDLGGGLGISYDGSPVPAFEDYAATVLPVLGRTGLTTLLEPGRVIVGPAGGPRRPRDRREGVLRRQAVRRARLRHDRTAASGALRRLSPHRAGDAAPRRTPHLRGRRTALREQRHRRQGPRAAAARGRRPGGRLRRRRLRIDDVVHLQPPAAAVRGDGGRGTLRRSSGGGRRSTT